MDRFDYQYTPPLIKIRNSIKNNKSRALRIKTEGSDEKLIAINDELIEKISERLSGL
jgi:hypothetical protein